MSGKILEYYNKMQNNEIEIEFNKMKYDGRIKIYDFDTKMCIILNLLTESKDMFSHEEIAIITVLMKIRMTNNFISFDDGYRILNTLCLSVKENNDGIKKENYEYISRVVYSGLINSTVIDSVASPNFKNISASFASPDLENLRNEEDDSFFNVIIADSK